MAILVFCSLALLVQTQREAAALHAPETTETSDVGSTEEYLPIITKPVEEQSQTVPQEEELELSEAARRVRAMLDETALTPTAAGSYVYVTGLNTVETTVGTAHRGFGTGLAELSGVLKMNPIAAFWQMVSGGAYEKTTDQSGVLDSASLPVPVQGAASYAYTQEGVRQLLTDLLTLAGKMGDGLALENALLGEDGAVESGQVHASDREGCYYAYFACGGERTTHILCFYLRPDKSGKQVADVEFQLLNLTAAIGNPEVLEVLDRRGTNQAASLMTAAELLLTGETRAGEGKVPFTYGFGGCNATIQRFAFQSEEEWGELINYRVKK